MRALSLLKSAAYPSSMGYLENYQGHLEQRNQ
jgi:hypothetical protein